MLLVQHHNQLLFHRSEGFRPDDANWHPTPFTNKADRLLAIDLIRLFLEKLMGAPEVKPLLHDDHISVDGTSTLRLLGIEDEQALSAGDGDRCLKLLQGQLAPIFCCSIWCCRLGPEWTHAPPRRPPHQDLCLLWSSLPVAAQVEGCLG